LACAGLCIGAFQLWLNSKISQSVAIKEFYTKFFEKSDLYSIWFNLFYKYSNNTFEKIERYINDNNIETLNNLWEHSLVDQYSLREHSHGRQEGERFWHPKLINYTREEENIDRLLGFMNILGDNFERGNVPLSEIGDAAEYYLFAIGNCEAFRAYLELNKTSFCEPVQYRDTKDDSPQRIRYGYPPFRHLCFLLSELDKNRRKQENRIIKALSSRPI
jgi:hypothetical protein